MAATESQAGPVDVAIAGLWEDVMSLSIGRNSLTSVNGTWRCHGDMDRGLWRGFGGNKARERCSFLKKRTKKLLLGFAPV
jgi:hypothetical protein